MIISNTNVAGLKGVLKWSFLFIQTEVINMTTIITPPKKTNMIK